MSEIFISADIEADGRVPGLSSMLSLGSVAFLVEKDGRYNELGSFEENLYELEGAHPDAEVMQWWETQQDAWKKCRVNPLHPEAAMRKYLNWLRSFPGTPIFIAYPGSYDFMFVYWYLYAFTKERPFGHDALCIKSYALGALQEKSWREFGKKGIPEKFRSNLPHDHTPLNDSREQALTFASLYSENISKKGA